jgi:hypothetical protein
LIIFLSVFLLLGACAKSKEQIVDKCLLSANQTFATDLSLKAMFFQGCMVENGFSFNQICDKDKTVDMLSGICYTKYK